MSFKSTFENTLIVILIIVAIPLVLIAGQVALAIGALAFFGFLILGGLEYMGWINLNNVSTNQSILYSALIGAAFYGIYLLFS